jgi:enoyl-CoA hydratase
MTHAIRPVDFDNLKTMTYEVTGRVARITFNRPEKGNAIVADTALELAALVERADLDPGVHVILVSGRGEGFCSGFEWSADADGWSSAGGLGAYQGTALDGKTQPVGHLPDRPWNPMLDYQMMRRFVRGFSSLRHADKPTVVKIHGYCGAGGTDIALHADQVIAASDAKIGYPPTPVWGVPATGLWAHRLGDQRAKRLLLTGDCITGAQAAEWGLAVEAPDPADLDDRAERLVERIAAVPVNQLIMVKLALNSALINQGVATSSMLGTMLDGIARNTSEGHAFVGDAVEHAFRDGDRQRDEPLSRSRSPVIASLDMPVRSLSRMTARSVLLSALLGIHPAWATVGELLRLTEDFDLKESTVRVALTRLVSAGDLVRSADGYRLSDRLLARQRRQDDAMQPQVRPWNGDWTTLVVTSIGTDARTRAALRSSLQENRFAELREGVWLRPDNLAVDLPDDVLARVQVLHARDDAPAELAARLWDLPAWSGTGHQLLDEMATATNTPARFAAAAAILRHLLTDPVLPDALLPDDWPGNVLRESYARFAQEFMARRDQTEPLEAL